MFTCTSCAHWQRTWVSAVGTYSWAGGLWRRPPPQAHAHARARPRRAHTQHSAAAAHHHRHQHYHARPSRTCGCGGGGGWWPLLLLLRWWGARTRPRPTGACGRGAACTADAAEPVRAYVQPGVRASAHLLLRCAATAVASRPATMARHYLQDYIDRAGEMPGQLQRFFKLIRDLDGQSDKLQREVNDRCKRHHAAPTSSPQQSRPPPARTRSKAAVAVTAGEGSGRGGGGSKRQKVADTAANANNSSSSQDEDHDASNSNNAEVESLMQQILSLAEEKVLGGEDGDGCHTHTVFNF